MEYIYTAMLLHSAKKEITESAVEKTLDAAGIKVDSAKAKALVASLKDINIDEAIKSAVFAAPAAAAPAEGKAAKKEEKKEEGKTEEEAAAGLGALFG